MIYIQSSTYNHEFVKSEREKVNGKREIVCMSCFKLKLDETVDNWGEVEESEYGREEKRNRVYMEF